MIAGPTDDRQRTSVRLSVATAALVIAFVALAAAFWYLQVLQHAAYQEMAENNHQRRLALRAPRGVLFDRDNRVLVENRDAYTISILREHTRNLSRTIRLLASVTGASEQRIRDTLARHRAEPMFRPIAVIEDASLAQVSAVLLHNLDFELPGVIVQPVPTRRYPSGGLAAHLIGYVGEVGEAQMAADSLRSGSVVGQTGIEKVYNRLLMGTDGERRVTVNSVGREISRLAETVPLEGRRIQLTLDMDLQQAAEDAFKASGFAGSAVFLDPRNGEILALVSLPAFDPNAFAAGIDQAAMSRLVGDRLRPLMNRATQGRYSPGSTFKIVVAAAGLEEHVITPEFTVMCAGGTTFYGRFFQCNQKGGHGLVDLRHAIEKSCNVYFYTVGNMVGIDRIHKWAELLGMAGKTGVDLPNEAQSLVPSTAWKMASTGQKWYAGETISVAIGQGQVSVTPLALAQAYATVANGGVRVTPRLVRAIDEGSGWTPTTPPAPSAPTLRPSTVAVLHDGLWLVVNGEGTGGRARSAGLDIAGKTGTAQVISLQGGKLAEGKTDLDLRDHGWFAFFAPRDHPDIAGVVLAEHAGHGYVAAPIARHVIETYYAKRAGRPLPVFVPPLVAPAAAAPLGVGTPAVSERERPR